MRRYPTAICLACLLFLVGSLCAAEQTAPTTRPAAVLWRIALVSDPHLSMNPRYADYLDNFQRVTAEVNQADVDVVLIAGDLTQSFDVSSAGKFNEMRKRFKAKTWCVAGNHDVGNKPQPGKPTTVTDARIGVYEKSIGPAFFAEDVLPGVRVIGITSSLLGTNLPSEQKQWDFLEKELQAPRRGITFLLTHYPPFAQSPDETDGYFNINSDVRPRLAALLKRGGVTAILSGHLHRPVTLNWDGIPILGAPATSFGLPEGKQQVGWRLVSLYADGSLTSELRYIETQATTRPSSSPSNQLLHPTGKID